MASEHVRGKVRRVSRITEGAEPESTVRAGERGNAPGAVSKGGVGHERLDHRACGEVKATALVGKASVEVTGGYGTLEVAELGQHGLLQYGMLGME